MWIPIILHINNKTIFFNIEKKDSIKNLKKKIKETFNITEREFYLTTKDNYLKPESNIRDYNLVPNTNIFVIYNLINGGYVFLNIKNKIERINVSIDIETNEIITKISEIKKYSEILLASKVNLFIFTDQEKIILNNFNLTLNEIGIKVMDKPLINNMIFIEN